MPESPKPADYLCLTGVWGPWITNPHDFLSSFGLSGPFKDTVQLLQTYSRCDLKPFEPFMPLDFHLLEQYRAFGPDWELWLRHLNHQEVRFRFLGKKADLKNDWQDALRQKGLSFEVHSLSEDLKIDPGEYPLVGEPLWAEAGSLLGWYTERLPRLLEYPVSLPSLTTTSGVPKTLLMVEHFRRPDSSIDLVRFTGLRVTTP